MGSEFALWPMRSASSALHVNFSLYASKACSNVIGQYDLDYKQNTNGDHSAADTKTSSLHMRKSVYRDYLYCPIIDSFLVI